MASISSTNSLGNTSLRGYGGMASGIDRDAIIEKMTLGTTTKINNQKGKITQLQWKQEAYRNISDQIMDFGDKYTSFSSTDSLKDANFFAKSIISVHGRDEATRFVTATGSSDLISNISIKGVKQLATSTVRQSDEHGIDEIQTGLSDLGEDWRSSKLKGSQLIFENDLGGGKKDIVRLTLPDGYVENDETKPIEYTQKDLDELARQLNEALKSADIDIGGTSAKDMLRFEVTYTDPNKKEGGKLNLTFVNGKEPTGYKVYGTAMTALGYSAKDSDSAIDAKNASLQAEDKTKEVFEWTGIEHKTALKGMTGAKLTFNYDGSQKEIELLTQDEYNAFTQKHTDLSNLTLDDKKEVLIGLQDRLNKAFGKDMVKAEFDSEGKLSFSTKNGESSLSVVSNDYALLNNLKISYGESNKVNLDGKLEQAGLLGKGGLNDSYLKDNALDLQINGVVIDGLTKNSTVSDILSKINSTSAAGVKATYVSATGQFMLVSTETGEGRQISLDSQLAKDLFGTKDKDGKYSETAGVSEGQDAIIRVSYGNGVDLDIRRASNSFNLEGLNVTVTGTFGGEYVEQQAKDENGNPKTEEKDGQQVPVMETVWKEDASQTVTFSAKADVDAIVERVKGFFEDFNKLATDVNNEITTRPDSSYGPLTDAQKDEMDETSIENWEKKAKQGMLYGDSAMRDLSTDVQGVFLKLMNSLGKDGHAKLKEMGITYSDDYNDGGTISFDESKFRTAVEKDSEAVGNLFTGGGGVSKGLVDIMDETFTPYATRYASKNGNGGKGSYGRLIEIAGSEKKPTTLLNNQIYNEIEDIQDLIARLQEQLKGEQDRYISQFTTMETLLNKMNTQSSYLSQLGS